MTMRRKSFRETLIANQRALDMRMALAGKPRIVNPLLAAMRPARAPSPQPMARSKPPVPLESDIQRSIIEYLIRHPQVGLVERHNSGAVESEHNGVKSWTRFHKVYMRGVRKSDLDCMMTDGKRLCIEVKRPPWTHPTDDREREQAAYLDVIRRYGGIGVFACSVADVSMALMDAGYEPAVIV